MLYYYGIENQIDGEDRSRDTPIIFDRDNHDENV